MMEMAYAFNEDKSKFDLDTIAGNMATIETSPVVSNHSKGEYILYENVLYEVISPIASGERLVLGTNVRSINIGDQLKSLRDSVLRYKGRVTGSYDDLTESGLYYTHNGMTNPPTSGAAYANIVVFAFDAGVLTQIVFDSDANVYTRKCAGSPRAWGNWKRLASAS